MHISIDIWECNPGEFHSEPLQTVSKWALHGPAMGQEDAALQNRTGAFCCPPTLHTSHREPGLGQLSRAQPDPDTPPQRLTFIPQSTLICRALFCAISIFERLNYFKRTHFSITCTYEITGQLPIFLCFSRISLHCGLPTAGQDLLPAQQQDTRALHTCSLQQQLYALKKAQDRCC